MIKVLFILEHLRLSTPAAKVAYNGNGGNIAIPQSYPTVDTYNNYENRKNGSSLLHQYLFTTINFEFSVEMFPVTFVLVLLCLYHFKETFCPISFRLSSIFKIVKMGMGVFHHHQFVACSFSYIFWEDKREDMLFPAQTFLWKQ